MSERFKSRLKLGALIAAALVLALLVWGVLIEPRWYDVERETAVLPRLPAAWEGRRIAVIADLQVGMWFGNTDTVRRIVARIIEERPAAALIAGAANVVLSFAFVKYGGLGLKGIVYGTILAVIGRCVIWQPWYVMRTLNREGASKQFDTTLPAPLQPL